MTENSTSNSEAGCPASSARCHPLGHHHSSSGGGHHVRKSPARDQLLSTQSEPGGVTPGGTGGDPGEAEARRGKINRNLMLGNLIRNANRQVGIICYSIGSDDALDDSADAIRKGSLPLAVAEALTSSSTRSSHLRPKLRREMEREDEEDEIEVDNVVGERPPPPPPSPMMLPTAAAAATTTTAANGGSTILSYK